MANVSRYATIFILVHGLVALVHEIAHRILPVILPFFRYALGYLFVGILPLVAMVMLWTRLRRAGLWLLLVSMVGSLLYAGWLHFVLHNPDHIHHAPQGTLLPTFQVTAIAMAVLEAFGCWLSVWSLRQPGR